MEIKKVYIKEENYPEQLRQLDKSPDPLYYAGNLDLLNGRCIGVVGTRQATQYGRGVARDLGNKIAAAGGVVVSGMASGIDSCAHWGAVNAGESDGKVKTVAVLGCGIDTCYPPSNEKLWKKLMEQGLIISEYAPGVPPAKFRFPERNRIISAVSEAVVVVQAPTTSGALITAERAMEQNKDVYVVPANINSEYSLGSNKLLHDGAMPLIVIDDLLRDRGLEPGLSEEAYKLVGKEENRVLEQLRGHGEMTADQLSGILDMPVSIVNGIITILEIKGIVCTSLGKIFIAK